MEGKSQYVLGRLSISSLVFGSLILFNSINFDDL